MAKTQRTPGQREKDFERIAEMYLAGKYMAEIAAAIGVSTQTISTELMELRRRWQDRYIGKIDARKSEELARIDRLEREYWIAWERSLGTSTTTTVTKTNGDKARGQVSKTTAERTGEAKFLAGVAWCIKARREVLGLDAPLKVHVQEDEHEWSDEEIVALAARLKLKAPTSTAVQAALVKGVKMARHSDRSHKKPRGKKA